MSKNENGHFLILDDSVILLLDGEVFSGPRAAAEKAGVLVALGEKNYRKAADLLNKEKSIVRRSVGAFTIENGVIYYKGQPVHNVLADRIVQFSDENLPFMSLVALFDNLFLNSSHRSVNELYPFLEHKGLPITEDGHFIAYKTVRSDYFSKTAGREPVEVSTDGGKTWETFIGRIPNKVGSIIRIQRNLVDDNREHECSRGLHVGSLEYAGPNGTFHSFGDKVVIVKVNPRDAVSVPRDHNAQKLRVSQYEVIGDFKAAYQAPLTSSDGSEFEGFDEPEAYCEDCEWEGSFSDLVKGRRCPDCNSFNAVRAYE